MKGSHILIEEDWQHINNTDQIYLEHEEEIKQLYEELCVSSQIGRIVIDRSREEKNRRWVKRINREYGENKNTGIYRGDKARIFFE